VLCQGAYQVSPGVIMPGTSLVYIPPPFPHLSLGPGRRKRSRFSRWRLKNRTSDEEPGPGLVPPVKNIVAIS